MNYVRLGIVFSAAMAYVVILFAFVFAFLACWSAFAGEPPVALPVVVPTPVPSSASDAAAYATGAGALGGLGTFAWFAKAMISFFVELKDHLKSTSDNLARAVKLLEKHDRRIEIEEAAEAKFRDTGPINIGVPR